MATALGKIKIEPKNLTWQAVGALTDDGEEDGSVLGANRLSEKRTRRDA